FCCGRGFAYSQNRPLSPAPKPCTMISLQIRNYGGVYVGLPSEAATMAPSQTKTEPKENMH
uniref:Uncharacterized protein n=1 Tax=Terrapene triunguis TaxID=2587831 RepID=A0A674JRQ5_9SAUR